jgi:single-stranded-DNA-specific exonuclease
MYNPKMENYAVRDPLLAPKNEDLAMYPPLLQELLSARGISGHEQAQKFLNPDYLRDTHNPFLMKNMERVVDRITAAINKGEKTIIYSDYDADGIPGAVVLHDLFKKLGYKNFENYIPDRHEEGFGLNIAAVEEFAKAGVNLIITIDCGIADNLPVARANELGMEVIITDHHEPNGEVPNAYAILNPKQVDCTYPEKILCGSGVIFKFVQAILQRKHLIKNASTQTPGAQMDENFGVGIEIKDGWEKWLLDMVGLATLSDMVPLTGENRAFAYYGLKVLRISPRVGLMKLLRKVNTNQRYLTEDDIGFTISPRINAASRMGVPMQAFTLLSTQDEAEAGVLADHLNKINDERKGAVAAITKEVRKKITERGEGEVMREILVMGNPNWRPSLLGLVANSLKDDHSRPVFLWGREGGTLIKGSCRSDGSVSVVELMEAVKESFVVFGGHAFSGGFSVSHEKIHSLEENLNVAYRKLMEKGAPEKEKVRIDKKITLEDVTWDTYKLIDKLSPFGVGNPKPVFLLEGIEVADMRQFGKEKNHLGLDFMDENGRKISAISFFSKPGDFSKEPKRGGKVGLVASLEKSTFMGKIELRLRIIDIV